MIKVDVGVPMPEKRVGVRGNPKYPFRDLLVGNSFYVACEDGELPRIVQARVSIGSQRHRKNGKRYATRIEGNGARVWRIEDCVTD